MSTEKKVAGHHGLSRCFQELRPRRPGSPGRGLDTVALQDGPDTRRREPDPQRRELPVDAPVAPCGIVPRELEHQADSAGRQARSTGCAMGLGPSPSHKITMPGKERFGLHEKAPPPNSREEPAERREHGPIRWPQGRACDLAAQHRDLGDAT